MSEMPAPVAELSPREKGFIAAIIRKYPRGQSGEKNLVRSLTIFTAMLIIAHAIEQLVPTWWLPFLIIYPPAVFLFTRYRKFSIFRSCVLSKVGARLAQYEPIAPGRPDSPAAAPHAHHAR